MRKPVLHSLNAAKQNFDLLKFWVIKKITLFVFEMKYCADKNINQRIGPLVYQHLRTVLCASDNHLQFQSEKYCFPIRTFRL